MATIWSEKDPENVVDYLLDWSPQLGEDEIATSTATSDQVSISPLDHTAKAATFRLTGGAAGGLAVIKARVTTVAGNILNETVYLPIVGSAQEGTGGYGSDAGFVAWISSQGLTLTGSLSPAALRQRGSTYVDGLYGADFPGVPAGGIFQERAWPRTGASAYGAAIPEDAVPPAIVNAAYAAALHEAGAPGSLAVAATSMGNVKREKVGEIDTEYFEGSGDAVSASTVRLSTVEALVKPFFAAPEVGVVFVV